MIDATLAKIFGTKNEREIKAMRPTIAAINDLEQSLQQLSDEALAARTVEFRQQLDNGAKLDDLLIPSFATVREAGRRILNMRHFDVQLIGGMVLHRGQIAEMKTGEGKTLVATAPVYLNALDRRDETRRGVHVVTVNDYLAKRDAEWMGRIYKFLGMTVGIIVHDLDDRERQENYDCDITYGTNNEFGFDYLRDNMKFNLNSCVQRCGHNFAIVDEVDSILIDEARTPLIISGPSEESTDKYYKANKVIPQLIRGEVIEGKEPGEKYTTGDFTVDEKHRTAALTEEGVLKVERILGIGNMFEGDNVAWFTHVQSALKAHVVFIRDKDYVVKDGEVIIVDEHTGRLMPGRRWSDGLHQAVEAKENVKIERENQTLATISFQNYFRMYKKLAGMTGTAETEAAEFQKIYKLDVCAVPTHRPMIRKENTDVVYRTEEEKFRNAAKEIKEYHERGQPVLVGTVSVEKSEHLSRMLKKMGIRHEVLNAKNHEREAMIVAQAGRKGAVTVSTNMAGRGTDILLGGNAEAMARDILHKQGKDPDREEFRNDWESTIAEIKAQVSLEHDEVVELGGLHIVGTERHDSRRIDNQLRGRAGRQGDPGSSRFFLSLQDDLLRIFGGQAMQNLMLRLGMEEDVPIESNLITKRIAAAQKAIETQNFEARKHLLEYDDVMNKQRQAVYTMRRDLLKGTEQKDRVMEMTRGAIGGIVDRHCPENEHPDRWDLTAIQTEMLNLFGSRIDPADLAGMTVEQIEAELFERAKQTYQGKEDLVGSVIMRDAERNIMLHVIDDQWKDHLLAMDHLKEGIGLRGYGQKDPLVEYKKESFKLFEAVMDRIEDETVRYLYFLRFEINQPALPFTLDEEGYEETPDEIDEEADAERKRLEQAKAAEEEQRRNAQSAVQDMTRSIQKQHEKELKELQFLGGNGNGNGNGSGKPTPVTAGPKVGRNDPCPCGSGKKYKKCHGTAA
jgi:preprotein translocase subunit SecA